MSPPDDPEVARRCPLLWELLTLDRYSDGSERVMPTLKIERVAGGYLAILQEHASRQQVQVKALKLGDVPRALESLLASDLDAWKPYDSPKVKERDLDAKEKKA